MINIAKIDINKLTLADVSSTEWCAQITAWYRDEGYTDEQVAEKLGITAKTLYNWLKKGTPESIRLKKARFLGKQTIDTIVENKLLEEAMNGNVTAIIFWLKNRKRKQWRDKWQEDDNDAANDRIVIVDDLDLTADTGDIDE